MAKFYSEDGTFVEGGGLTAALGAHKVVDNAVAVNFENFEFRANIPTQQFEMRFVGGTKAITNSICSYVRTNGSASSFTDRNITLTGAWVSVWQDGTLNNSNAGDYEELHFTADGVDYYFKGIIGSGYNGNRIRIERVERISFTSKIDNYGVIAVNDQNLKLNGHGNAGLLGLTHTSGADWSVASAGTVAFSGGQATAIECTVNIPYDPQNAGSHWGRPQLEVTLLGSTEIIARAQCLGMSDSTTYSGRGALNAHFTHVNPPANPSYVFTLRSDDNRDQNRRPVAGANIVFNAKNAS